VGLWRCTKEARGKCPAPSPAVEVLLLTSVLLLDAKLLLAGSWTETDPRTSRARFEVTTLLEAASRLLGRPPLLAAMLVATTISSRCASWGLLQLLSTTATAVDRGRRGATPARASARRTSPGKESGGVGDLSLIGKLEILQGQDVTGLGE
jgi:hypothetical protein